MADIKLPLGQIVFTPNAVDVAKEHDVNVIELINRHQSGDWGDLSSADKYENDFSVKNGFRVLSSYVIAPGVKLWIITESDRSVTTVLTPEDY